MAGPIRRSCCNPESTFNATNIAKTIVFCSAVALVVFGMVSLGTPVVSFYFFKISGTLAAKIFIPVGAFCAGVASKDFLAALVKCCCCTRRRRVGASAYTQMHGNYSSRSSARSRNSTVEISTEPRYSTGVVATPPDSPSRLSVSMLPLRSSGGYTGGDEDLMLPLPNY